jgi:hypothetical protein
MDMPSRSRGSEAGTPFRLCAISVLVKASRAVPPLQPPPGLDPYRAPAAKESVPPSTEEPAGTFAIRVSLLLALLGIVLFWGVLLLVRFLPWEYKPTGLAMSWALILSGTLHLVGLGVVWAAPPHRRVVGLSVNGVALLAMITLIVLLWVS